MYMVSYYSIRIWDTRDGACLDTVLDHGAEYVVSYYSIYIWDTRDGTCLDTVLDHGADVYGKLL